MPVRGEGPDCRAITRPAAEKPRGTVGGRSFDLRAVCQTRWPVELGSVQRVTVFTGLCLFLAEIVAAAFESAVTVDNPVEHAASDELYHTTDDALAIVNTLERIGRVLAPVMINGHRTFRFDLDTGANRSVLSPRVTAAAGLAFP